MSSQVIEVEAESLEEAEKQINAQIPDGFALLSKKVLSDGKQKTVKAVAETAEAAWAKVQAGLPANAEIINKTELVPPGKQYFKVDAFDEQGVKAQVGNTIGETRSIKSIKQIVAPKKGLWGVGKSPGTYNVEVMQQGVVEVTYQAPVRIRATLDCTIAVEIAHLRGVPQWDPRIEKLLPSFVDDFSRQYPLISDESLIWLFENYYFIRTGDSELLKKLITLLLEADCRNGKVWKSLFERSYGNSTTIGTVMWKFGVHALDFLLWYLYSPEALNTRTRLSAQGWFLNLVKYYYSKCEPPMQERIVEVLEDMIMNWKNQYFYVIPHCCTLLEQTGRKDVLKCVLEGIHKSNDEYVTTFSRYAQDDTAAYTMDPSEELDKWQQLKERVREALKNGDN
jgi:hypothetical protein